MSNKPISSLKMYKKKKKKAQSLLTKQERDNQLREIPLNSLTNGKFSTMNHQDNVDFTAQSVFKANSDIKVKSTSQVEKRVSRRSNKRIFSGTSQVDMIPKSFIERLADTWQVPPEHISRINNATCRNAVIRKDNKESLMSGNCPTVSLSKDNIVELSKQLAATLEISSKQKSDNNNTVNRDKIVKSMVFTRKSQNNRKAIRNTVATSVASCKQRKIEPVSSNKVECNNKLKKDRLTNKTKMHVTTNGSRSSITKDIIEKCHKSVKKKTVDKEIRKKETAKNIKDCTTEELVFPEYLPRKTIERILTNQTSNKYVVGNLQVFHRKPKRAYISMGNGKRDLLINSIINRNRAFEGDLVVASITNYYTHANGDTQQTGEIVHILKKLHPRKAIGHLEQQDSCILFHSTDCRFPLVKIVAASVPTLYREQPELFKDTIFQVKINSWENAKYAVGQVISVVGKTNDFDAQLTAILMENYLDVSPYKEKLLQNLPSADYVLTTTDIKDREDWRHECIFTIDPDNAIDLEDAVSCKLLDNGNYEIGVHISDVTHFLEFFSPLDIEISKRATSVYLANACYHMLPKQLYHVCSLLPGEDRLTFSVIWEMTREAKIIQHRFAKTVIRSCCKISYNSAQKMIENPEKTWPENFLDIKGNYTISSLSYIINNLYRLSTQLRNKRYADGALKLEQPKLFIRIDDTMSKEYGIPVDYYLQQIKDSNILIEELMLLTNMTVSLRLYNMNPETALLRVHKDPSENLTKTADMLRNYGIHLKSETAASLHASIQHYEEYLEDSDTMTVINPIKDIIMVIINLCSKSMARAEYQCSSTVSSLSDLKHYALNVPFYTHFTSPFRRYADCIVHRLLSAIIENKPLPEKWSAQLCSSIATISNIKRYSAKLAQEQSIALCFTHIVNCAGGFRSSAIVLEVTDRIINVILRDSGLKVSVKLTEMKDQFKKVKYENSSIPTLYILWKETNTTQVINVFNMVDVRVEKHSNQFLLKATLLPSKNNTNNLIY